MNDEILYDVIKRLKRIEKRLDDLESQKVESVAPPPIIKRPVQKQRSFGLEEAKERARFTHTPSQTQLQTKSKEPEPKEEEPVAEREDKEFVFGSKILPRVGMFVILLGIFYLVILGIQEGWITPGVQFIGELLLCASLVSVGVWKLNEGADFGQVLAGGGSCGLYLSFAGAYTHKDIINGETLVVLFAALSLANFAFSWWRSSKSFWMIGYVGGLVAAGMPLDRDDYTSSLALASIIVVAATLLAAHRQWFKALAGLWLVSSIFVVTVTQQAISSDAMSVSVAISIFYAFSFVPLLAHAHRFVPNKFDDKGWFFLIAGCLTALVTLTLGWKALPVPHSVGVVLWSALLLATAYYVRTKPHGEILLYTGVITATVVAPLGLTALAACLTYAGLGLFTTVVVKSLKKDLTKVGASFSASFVVLTIAAYGVAMANGPVETTIEMTMLGAIALGMANVAYVAGKLNQNMAQAATVAAALFYPVLARAAYVSAGAEQAYTILLTQSIYVVALAVISLRAKWQGLGILGLVISSLGMIIYWGLIANDASDISSGKEIAGLLVLTASLVLSAIGAGRDSKEQHLVSTIAAVMGGFVVVPAINLALGSPLNGLPHDIAIATSIVSYAIVLGTISLFAKWPGHALVGSTAILIATVYYWAAVVANQGIDGTSSQLFLMVLTSAAIGLSAFCAGRESSSRQIAWVAASILGLFVLARAIFLVLVLPAIGFDEQTALLSSWAIYAIALAVTSNRTKMQSLAAVAYFTTVLSAGTYWSYRYQDTLAMGLSDQMIALVLQSAALVLGTFGLGRNKDELQKAALLTSVIGWFIFAHLINVTLTLPAIGMAEQAALTTSWSLYSALVLTLGFAFNFKSLRIASLVMFGVTIVKVFLVDLAELDDVIRVVVLVVLGALLVLGGYIYVRKRQDTATT